MGLSNLIILWRIKYDRPQKKKWHYLPGNWEPVTDEVTVIWGLYDPIRSTTAMYLYLLS